MIQTVSIKTTRDNIADLVNQVDIAKREFIITKFGKPKAMLVPIKANVNIQGRKVKSLPGFGAWADRKDMKDSAAFLIKGLAKFAF